MVDISSVKTILTPRIISSPPSLKSFDESISIPSDQEDEFVGPLYTDDLFDKWISQY